LFKKCNSNSEQPSAIILQNIIINPDRPQSVKDKVVNAGGDGLVGQNYIENDTDTVQDNIARYDHLLPVTTRCSVQPKFFGLLVALLHNLGLEMILV